MKIVFIVPAFRPVARIPLYRLGGKFTDSPTPSQVR